MQRCHWSKLWSTILTHPSTKSLRQIITRNAATISESKYGALVTRPAMKLSSTPVVAILGWNDATMRNIQKYGLIFEKKHWTTVCLPATSFNTFFRPSSKVKSISMHTMELLKQLTSSGSPVLLYSLSSGGCMVYYHIVKALTTPGTPNYNAFKVIGSIFDSCPVKNTFEGIQRLQISVTERVTNPVVKSLIWHAVGITMPLVVKFEPLLAGLFDDLQSMTLGSPELYLYSKEDKLAMYDDIDDYIAQRKAEGFTVFDKRWDDSAHVSHYMNNPDQYLEVLEKFLEFACIKIIIIR